MTHAEIAGTEVILKYDGWVIAGLHPPIYVKDNRYVLFGSFSYHESLNDIAPVAKRVIAELIDNATSDSFDERYEYVKDILRTPFDVGKVFTAVVAAINFINDKKKEENE